MLAIALRVRIDRKRAAHNGQNPRFLRDEFRAGQRRNRVGRRIEERGKIRRETDLDKDDGSVSRARERTAQQRDRLLNFELIGNGVARGSVGVL